MLSQFLTGLIMLPPDICGQQPTTELYALYKPKIQASTEKKIVAGVSTKDSWVALTGKWNTLANSVAGRIASLKPVNTDLDDYLTNKALSGMFMKVEIEELKDKKGCISKDFSDTSESIWKS